MGKKGGVGWSLCAVEGLELRATFTHMTGSLGGLKPFDEYCLGQSWADVTTKSSPLHALASYLCVPVKCPGPCFSCDAMEESPASLGEAAEWGLKGASLLLHSPQSFGILTVLPVP